MIENNNYMPICLLVAIIVLKKIQKYIISIILIVITAVMADCGGNISSAIITYFSKIRLKTFMAALSLKAFA